MGSPYWLVYATPFGLNELNRINRLARMEGFYLALVDNWAVTCDFQQCGIFTSLDSDEPVQHPVKLKNPNDV